MFSSGLNVGQGVGAPEDVHPRHLQSADGSKTNHSQFFVHSGSDIVNFPEKYDLLSGAFQETLKEIIAKVQLSISYCKIELIIF
jgi:hypothetical protein